MKRNLIITVLLLATFMVSNAQLNIGIKAGYNSSLSVNNIGSLFDGTYNLNSAKDEMWNNFHIGAFARFNTNKIYIEPAILYSLEKKQYEVSFQDVTNGNVSFDKFAEIKTIDIPVLLGIKLFDMKIGNVRAFAGPKLRFDAGSNLRFSDANILIAEVIKANLGLEIGAGVDLFMFALDLRYNLISNMYETKIEDVKFDPANTFVVSLAWKLF